RTGGHALVPPAGPGAAAGRDRGDMRAVTDLVTGVRGGGEVPGGDHLVLQIGVLGVHPGVQDCDLHALAVVPGGPRLGRADLPDRGVEVGLADPVQPDTVDAGGGPVAVGDRLPQFGRVPVRGLHGVGVESLQGAAQGAGVPHLRLRRPRPALVPDDDLETPLVGAADRGPGQLRDVEEPPVQLAAEDETDDVRGHHIGVAAHPADLDGYAFASLGAFHADDAALGVDG